MWLAAGRLVLVVLSALPAVMVLATNRSISLQCRSSTDFVPAVPSPLDFAQISQRRASSIFFLKPRPTVHENITVARSDAFQRDDCTCASDWSVAFCAHAEYYARLPNDRAPTVCVCRRVTYGCTQFSARCFAESLHQTHRRRRSDFPIVYGKGDVVERGADGVLRRPWFQPQRNGTIVLLPRRVANKSQKSATVTKHNMTRDVLGRCRCCFNQPDEYCDQLECRGMRPYFGTGPSADGVVCECFERREYPAEICDQWQVAKASHADGADSGGGVQARNTYLSHERRRDSSPFDWRLHVKRPAFDRTRLFCDDEHDDSAASPRGRLVRVDVAVLAALLSAGAAVALVGYCAVGRWRRRRAAVVALPDRGQLDETMPLEEQVHIV